MISLWRRFSVCSWAMNISTPGSESVPMKRLILSLRVTVLFATKALQMSSAIYIDTKSSFPPVLGLLALHLPASFALPDHPAVQLVGRGGDPLRQRDRMRNLGVPQHVHESVA